MAALPSVSSAPTEQTMRHNYGPPGPDTRPRSAGSLTINDKVYNFQDSKCLGNYCTEVLEKGVEKPVLSISFKNQEMFACIQTMRSLVQYALKNEIYSKNPYVIFDETPWNHENFELLQCLVKKVVDFIRSLHGYLHTICSQDEVENMQRLGFRTFKLSGSGDSDLEQWISEKKGYDYFCILTPQKRQEEKI